MKLDNIFESPIKNLPIEAQKHIADDMEDVARLAMNVSNAIYSGTDKEVEFHWAEFESLVKRTKSQYEQR